MFSAFEMRMPLSLPTTVPIAKAIQLRKAESSAWIHQTFRQTTQLWLATGLWRFQSERLAVARNHSLHPKSGRTSSNTNFFKKSTETGMSSVSTTNICRTDNDFDRPLRDGASLHRYPGTSCLATISLSLRDKSHSFIVAPHKYFSAYAPFPQAD